jgi:hypothetical protein
VLLELAQDHVASSTETREEASCALLSELDVPAHLAVEVLTGDQIVTAR